MTVSVNTVSVQSLSILLEVSGVVAAVMMMDSSATETDDETPPDNPVHVGRRKKRRESSDPPGGVAKKRMKRNHKDESPKKKTQLKTRTIYCDTKVICCPFVCIRCRLRCQNTEYNARVFLLF